MTGDLTVAEDLVQDAFAAVLPRWSEIAEPRGYVRVTLVHLVGRYRTRERHRRDRHLAYADADVVTQAASELFDVLNRLPARQRAVIVMRYFEDMSEAEIAAALGCAPGTVKSLASRALQTLRTEIAP